MRLLQSHSCCRCFRSFRSPLCHTSHRLAFAAASEYPNLYCRHCGTGVFAPRSSAFRVCALPSPYWSELTELWFCHTADNAHIDRIAASKIVVSPGTLLVDKLLMRVDRGDLHAQGDAWRRHASVQKLVAGIKAAASDATHAMSDISSSDSRDIWSPLPCSGCPAVIGSILLTITPSLDPEQAIRPSAFSREAKLFKYQLSNCFRKRETPTRGTGDAEAKEAGDAMQTDGSAASSSAAAAAGTSTAATPASDASTPSFCLCSFYAPSPLLRCSSLYSSYTFENLVTEDLLQRYHKQPIGKFLIDNGLDDEAGSAPILIRMFVTQWDMPIASSAREAFPYTPRLADSNAMVPVIKLEFAAHHDEEDPLLQTWIFGRKKKSKTTHTHEHAHPTGGEHAHSCSHGHGPAAAATAASAVPNPIPSNIDRVSYSTADCRLLLHVLHARSHMWPESCRSAIDANMKKSCLVKLTRHIKA